MDVEDLSRAANDFLHELETIEESNRQTQRRYAQRQALNSQLSPLSGRIEQYGRQNHPYASQKIVRTSKGFGRTGEPVSDIVKRDSRRSEPFPADSYQTSWSGHRNGHEERVNGFGSPATDASESNASNTSSAYSSFSSGVESGSTLTDHKKWSRLRSADRVGPSRPSTLNPTHHTHHSMHGSSGVGSKRVPPQNPSSRSYSEQPTNAYLPNYSLNSQSMSSTLRNDFQDIFDRFDRDFAELSCRNATSPTPEFRRDSRDRSPSASTVRSLSVAERPSSRTRIVDRDYAPRGSLPVGRLKEEAREGRTRCGSDGDLRRGPRHRVLDRHYDANGQNGLPYEPDEDGARARGLQRYLSEPAGNRKRIVDRLPASRVSHSLRNRTVSEYPTRPHSALPPNVAYPSAPASYSGSPLRREYPLEDFGIGMNQSPASYMSGTYPIYAGPREPNISQVPLLEIPIYRSALPQYAESGQSVSSVERFIERHLDRPQRMDRVPSPTPVSDPTQKGLIILPQHSTPDPRAYPRKAETVVFANANARRVDVPQPMDAVPVGVEGYPEPRNMSTLDKDRTIFGTCAECKDVVTSKADSCQALGRLYHVTCFSCSSCGRSLRGRAFYTSGDKLLCEDDYLYAGAGAGKSVERCHICSQLITEMILQAVGKSYHPACFRCVSCSKPLDGIPFTVDGQGKVYCVGCYHKTYAPTCHACKMPITPISGMDETVRVVSMKKDFHVDCYVCEGCGMNLNDEPGHLCYPLDDHLLCQTCHLHWARTGGSRQPITDL